MGQSLDYQPVRLSRAQLDLLCRQIRDAAEYMADEQVLCLADSLHDTLRERRRAKANTRIDDHQCRDGAPVFPF